MTTPPGTPPRRIATTLDILLRIVINLLAVLAFVVVLAVGANVYRGISSNSAAMAAAVTAQQAANPAACSPRAGWASYTVAEGDTLDSVSAKFNTGVIVLAVGNCLSDATLKPGQIIAVPPAAVPTP